MLAISIMTLITSIAWVGFEVYRALTKTQAANVTKEQLAPLDPKLNFDLGARLEKRVSFSQEELNNIIPDSNSTARAMTERASQ